MPEEDLPNTPSLFRTTQANYIEFFQLDNPTDEEYLGVHNKIKELNQYIENTVSQIQLREVSKPLI